MLKCEDIVDKEGSKGECGDESSEDHDRVRGWEVGTDEQILLWCYFAEISQVGQWSHCDPSDEFEHTLFVFTSITLQKIIKMIWPKYQIKVRKADCYWEINKRKITVSLLHPLFFLAFILACINLLFAAFMYRPRPSSCFSYSFPSSIYRLRSRFISAWIILVMLFWWMAFPPFRSRREISLDYSDTLFYDFHQCDSG